MSLTGYLKQMVLLGALLMGGCVLSPPIEGAPVEQNKPPFLDDFQPSLRTVQVTTPNKILRARLFDQNREASLYAAWFGKKSGFIKVGPQPILTNVDLVNGIFYEYEPAVFDLSTCSNKLRNENSETIWLYVSDSPLDFPDTNTITKKKGAFIESYSWNLIFTPDRCSNANN